MAEFGSLYRNECLMFWLLLALAMTWLYMLSLFIALVFFLSSIVSLSGSYVPTPGVSTPWNICMFAGIT